MCQKGQTLQAAGKGGHLSAGLLHSTEGRCGFITQGLGHLEKELRTSGNTSCGVQIVQSEHPRRIPKAIGWADFPGEAS